MIDAVTLEDAKRVAKRLLDGGMLVTVVGRPQGPDLDRLANASRRGVKQSLPLVRSEAEDRHAADAIHRQRARADDRPARRPPTLRWTRAGAHRARRSTGCARAMPTARCRCCACRKSATTSPPILRLRGAALRDGATDIVLLGTGGSSLGGQTLAQLAGHAVPGVGALRDGAAPAFHGQSRSRDASARCWSGCRCRPRASSRSRSPAAPARR